MITLGLVCARSGSEGLPHKNLLELDGERLIERAIRIAFEAGCDDVAVSTDYVPGTDYEPFVADHVDRPPELAGPDAGKWAVYEHAVTEWEKYTGKTALRIVDVDVTRPLRTADTVRRCLNMLDAVRPVAMAVVESDKHPAFDILRHNGTGLETYERSAQPIVRRQSLPPVFQHAGAYAMTREGLMGRTHLWGGPVSAVGADRIESFDIDDELDWQIVQALHAVSHARTR